MATNDEAKFLFYISSLYYDKDRPKGGPRQDGYHMAGGPHSKIMTEDEATATARGRLKADRDFDPSFGGLVDGKKVKRIVRVRKVHDYTDTYID